MDSLKETLDFSIVSDKKFGYAVRLKGSVYDGLEYRYTMLKMEMKPVGVNLYFDYEITRNPNGLPVSDELKNFVSFVTERLVRSGLVKVVDEANRNNHTRESPLR